MVGIVTALFSLSSYGEEHLLVTTWSVEDVSLWLNSLGLSQYASQFKANDIRGHELIHLERTDMKDLGMHKIGHVKRLQVVIVVVI